MKQVNVHEAKTSLSQLLLDVEQGEEVVIARQGVPVARLVLIHPPAARKPGSWRSHPGWEAFVYDPQVLAPMTDQEMQDEGWI
jgi:prevent-host-death family protein